MNGEAQEQTPAQGSTSPSAIPGHLPALIRHISDLRHRTPHPPESYRRIEETAEDRRRIDEQRRRDYPDRYGEA